MVGAPAGVGALLSEDRQNPARAMWPMLAVPLWNAPAGAADLLRNYPPLSAASPAPRLWKLWPSCSVIRRSLE